jgi:hypothetical protein
MTLQGYPADCAWCLNCAVRWPYYMLSRNLQLSKNLLTSRLTRLKTFTSNQIRKNSASLRLLLIQQTAYFLGRFAPYFERDCIRPLTPAQSNEPRTV